MIPEHIMILLDCYRPGLDQLESEEFSDLASWVAENQENANTFQTYCRIDTQIGRSFRDVDAPADLAANLKSSLSNLQTNLVVPELRPSDLDSVKNSTHLKSSRELRINGVHRQNQPRQSNRRRIVGLFTVAASLLLVGVLWWVGLPSNQPVMSAEQLGQQSFDWIRSVQDINWLSESKFDVRDREIPEDVTLDENGRAAFHCRLDANGVVYDLSSPGSRQAFLFVIRPKNAQVHATALFPEMPNYQNNDFSVGICRRGELVYVLVIEGGQTEYRNAIRPRYGVG